MASYLHRLRTNLKWVFLIILLLAVLLTGACNYFLSSSKQKFTFPTDPYFTQRVFVGRLFYLPPCFIILKDVAFSEAGDPDRRRILSIPWIGLRFSLKDIILQRRLSVLGVVLGRPSADSARLSKFVTDNFSRIVDFIKSLAWQDLRVLVRNARLEASQENQSFGPTFATCDFSIKGASMSLKGFIRGKGDPVIYHLQGELIGKDLVFEKIEFEKKNLRAHFWGSLAANTFYLKGYAFANTLAKEEPFAERPFRQKDFIKGLARVFRKPKKSAQLLGLSQANFYLLDLDCVARLDLPKVQINRLNFSLNNIPLSFKGEVLLGNPLTLELAASGYLGNLKDNQKESLKRIDLKITGSIRDKIFEGDGFFNFDFVQKSKGSLPLEKAQGEFSGLSLDFSRYPLLKVNFKTGDLFCKTQTNDYKVKLNNFESLANLSDNRLKRMKFRSLFYDGYLYGEGSLLAQGLIPKIAVVLRVRDVSANNLEDLLIHFSKVFGKLSGIMFFRNSPDLDLRGHVQVQAGHLNNFEFFKWLAELFELPGLRRVDFSSASSDFSVNASGAWLQGMDLRSQDVNLFGYFGLGENEYVSSKMALTFSMTLLEQSPKFAALLRLLDKDLASLCFDFQLSGVLHKMNFHWLQSDFKKRLQDAIPNFIERRIDRNIEEAIGNITVSP